MLDAHLKAANQVSIARELAAAAGYKSWRGMNLQYGLLAKRIAGALQAQPQNLSLLVEFVRPHELRNTEWLILMRPTFARALKKSGWLTPGRAR